MNQQNNREMTKFYLKEKDYADVYNPPIMRNITLSCEIFGGFTRYVNVSRFENIQTLINYVLITLRDVLRSNHLDNLLTKLDNTWHLYHIHDYDIYNVLIEDREYYICNHGCS